MISLIPFLATWYFIAVYSNARPIEMNVQGPFLTREACEQERRVWKDAGPPIIVGATCWEGK